MLIVCPNCQSNIHVPQAAAGKKGKCPRCGTILTVPPALDAAPPVAPPPTVPVPSPAPKPLPPLPATGYASEIPPPLPAEPPPVPRAPRRYDADDEPRRRYDDDEDDDDLSIRRPRRRHAGRGMAITAMVLGLSGLLLSAAGVVVIIGGASFGQPDLCCYGCLGGTSGIAVSGLLGLLGVIFGFIGVSQAGRGFALTGIITGGIALLLVLAYIVLIILMMFGVIVAVGAAANAQQGRQPFPPPQPR